MGPNGPKLENLMSLGLQIGHTHRPTLYKLCSFGIAQPLSACNFWHFALYTLWPCWDLPVLWFWISLSETDRQKGKATERVKDVVDCNALIVFVLSCSLSLYVCAEPPQIPLHPKQTSTSFICFFFLSLLLCWWHNCFVGHQGFA